MRHFCLILGFILSATPVMADTLYQANVTNFSVGAGFYTSPQANSNIYAGSYYSVTNVTAAPYEGNNYPYGSTSCGCNCNSCSGYFSGCAN